MAMDEPFNFSKHLNEIIGKELKKCGFLKKSNKFIRINEEYKEHIYFLRNRFNIPNLPFEFFLELYSYSSDETKGDNIRLNRSLSFPMPEYYKNYIKKGYQEEEFNRFSTEQKQEISTLIFSTMWRYSSEDELIKLLHESKELLFTRGFEYFEKVKNFIDKDDRDELITYKLKINNL